MHFLRRAFNGDEDGGPLQTLCLLLPLGSCQMLEIDFEVSRALRLVDVFHLKAKVSKRTVPDRGKHWESGGITHECYHAIQGEGIDREALSVESPRLWYASACVDESGVYSANQPVVITDLNDLIRNGWLSSLSACESRRGDPPYILGCRFVQP